MSRDAEAVRRGAGGSLDAGRFKVPQHYLELLVGDDAARGLRLRAAAGKTDIGEHQGFMPTLTFMALCLQHIVETGDESFGVTARPIKAGTFNRVLQSAAQGGTLGEAFSRFVEAARFLRPDVVFGLTRKRDALDLSLRFAGKRSGRAEMYIEIVAVCFHCAMRWITGRSLRLEEVRVAEGAEGFERTLLGRVLRSDVRIQGTGVTLRYGEDQADLPIDPGKVASWANMALEPFEELLEDAAQDYEKCSSAPVRGIAIAVRNAVSSGAHSEASAAKQLGMSTATLRRKLSQVETSFRAILADVQRKAAENLFAAGKSLDAIALEIGYSDVRSLRRACQRWFGVTPSAYRQGARARQSARGLPRLLEVEPVDD